MACFPALLAWLHWMMSWVSPSSTEPASICCKDRETATQMISRQLYGEPPIHSERIKVVKHIAFTNGPLKAKEATKIEVRLERVDGSTHVKTLSYDDIRKMEGGKEALEKLKHSGIQI
ncbi:hypothetical protein BGW36DRAFT_362894 [Talaromyces proteolyticus]|uniref:Uncharacterized protein n=1 Tax=Talaromyces proteolyticus TaxID=1131652 RepID=A0AAD4KGJ0_9EURO|nr:uncharacterized protein BGW36DRAFT_362894 [Talaromyces proteolyticus]KAH8691863.1 hypothetical protein BGW36DRAFT_362894 [Talaromyces proteolyticus]